MDQQLLEELYGTTEAEATNDEELIKEAQAELIEAVADEAGIDLNTLDDDELDKFAEYVLTPDEGEAHQDPNLATADAMGRQMAHAYADEQVKIASQLQGEDMIDEVLLEKAAEWDLAKEAASPSVGQRFGQAKDAFMNPRGEGFADRTPREQAQKAKGAMRRGKDRVVNSRAVKAMGRAGRAAGSGLARGTGVRDIKRARELSKQLKGVKQVEVGRTPQKFWGGGNEAIMRDVDRMKRVERANAVLNPSDPGSISPNQAKAMRKAQKGRTGRMVRGADIKSYQDYKDAVRARRGLAIRGGAKALASLGATAGVAYGAKRLMDKQSSFQGYEDQYYEDVYQDYDQMDKEALFEGEYYEDVSHDPAINWIEDLDGHEFAKLAEYRAAEILAANGVHPESFEEIEPEHIKVANFPEPEDAVDYNSAEEISDYNDALDDAALDILESLGFLDEE
jgi:hypothetical protein